MTLQQKIDCAVAHISAGTHYIGTKNQISGVAVECKATADAKEVVSHAFRLGVILILLLGAVLALVVWLYRRLMGPRGRQPKSTASGSG